MTRLLVMVEGETEETFVNEILHSHLMPRGYSLVSARLMGNARQRDRRGGIRPWPAVRQEILRHLKEDAQRYVTTMVDYYALPQDVERGWPGRASASRLPFPEKASHIQTALQEDIQQGMGRNFDPQRFIPYVMMHEFEGLLFSDCQKFSIGIGQPGLAPQFQAIRDRFQNPEEINDSPVTAPSKRVEALVPDYQKPLLGTLAILEIGLERVRAECPHFRSWIEKLEQLPQRALPE